MARWGFDVSRPRANLQTPGPFFFKWVRFEPTAHLDRRANRLQFVDPYPLLQIPAFFRVSCRPSTKKGGIYRGNPGFSKNTLEKGRVFGGYGGTLGLGILRWD